MKLKKGFSLIEVIIALAVFMIIIIPIFSLTLGTTKITKQSEDKLKALAIGQQVMEKLKSGNIHENLFGSEKKEKKDTQGDFNVDITVEPTEYKFKHEDGNMDKPSKDIKYDEEIDILENTIYKNTDQMEIRFRKSKGLLYIINKENHKEKEVNIKVNLRTNSKIDAIIENNTESMLNVYFVKKDVSECNCDVTNTHGKVRIYSNLVEGEEKDDNTKSLCRLYRIKVIVSKKGEKLQNIEGYRTFLK